MIRFKDYSFTYAMAQEPALRHVNLTFEQGGFYLVCGESGCGKTTLLRQMKTELMPEGTVTGLLELTEGGYIGYVGQNPEDMIVTDTVWHELAFGLENMGCELLKMERRIAEFSQFFGLTELFLQDTASLSGGQKQLLALAGVMIMQPKVLLLDEPTAQLDPLAAAEFIQALRRINEELGTTIIVCEHRLEELFAISDQIILMSHGQPEYIGTPREMTDYLMSHKDTARLYAGLPTAVRLFGGLHGTGECPITLKQARAWFECAYPSPAVSKLPQEPESFGNPILQMKELFFRYEMQGPDILRATDYTLYEGKWHCLLGANGAGKSTLIQVMAQNYMSHSGQIRYRGQLCTKKQPMPLGFGNLVLLPQNPKVLFGEISVREELEVMLRKPYYPQELAEDNIKERIDNALDQMELKHAQNLHPYDLSGGQQQKLAIAKLLLLEPSIIVLDEPTKGMDPGFKKEFAAMMQALKAKGVTILMVSHDVEFAAEYADICGLFFDGRVVGNNWTRAFFAGNQFYITNTNRIVSKQLPDAITIQEVVSICTTE